MTNQATLKSIIDDLKHRQHPALNWAALLLIAGLFAAGWTLIISPSGLSCLGIPILAEAMILSFYLSHDCAHLAAFTTRRQNLVIGQLLFALAGQDAAAFAHYRRDHHRHHAEQTDFVGVNLHETVAAKIKFFRSILELCESLYIPASYLLVQLESLRNQLSAHPKARRRLALHAAARLAPLIAIAFISPRACLWYGLAAIVRIHVIRFVDAFQHTFSHGDLARRTPHRGWIYEQHNTFSFPLFKHGKLLNLLILNFGYHNAHHAMPHCPWYNLPHLDTALRQLSRQPTPASRPFAPPSASLRALLATYHRHRVTRLLTTTPDIAYDAQGHFSLTSFKGVLSDNLLG